MSDDKVEKVRLDKWLWFTRQVKTRNLGSQLVSRGKFRVNEQPVTKASYGVKEGDVISGVIHEKLRVLKVVDIGARRGPYEEAKLLYDDLTPVDELETFFPPTQPRRRRRVDNHARNDHTGRPTKRDRRELDKFTKNQEFE